MKKKVYILIFIMMAIFCSLFFLNLKESWALSKYGSSGNEVTAIQKKLKSWGYYNGNIDGISVV